MPLHPSRRIATTDFDLARHVPDYWARADRETFLFWALLHAARLLTRRRIPIPEPPELERVVLAAYQSACLLEHVAPLGGFAFIEQVNSFIVQAAKACRQRQKMIAAREW